MKKRQVIIILVAVAIVVGAKLISDVISVPEERKAKKPQKAISTVFTTTVENDSIPILVESTGVLEAVNRLELFAEVQGVMLSDEGRFKAGNAFRKGEVLIAIRSNDQQAQLYAQRSSFESALTAVMVDLKSDYANEFPTWENYLVSYSSEKSVSALPAVTSAKLKSFLVGRGIYSAYHALKNMEIINAKYRITAPYNGVLIEANVDPGTVIRQGQALGTFIQPEAYEMETTTDAMTAEKLSVGQSVQLTMQGEEGKTWNGKISRLVKAIDRNSQLTSFFVAVNGADLKEGMYLTATVEAGKIPNAFEFSRSALVGNDQVYVVKADTLIAQTIQQKFIGQSTVVVSGLQNGDQLLTKVPPSAFEGMNVSIYKENK